MQRREFITLIASAGMSLPLVARAQQPRMPVVGFLNSASPGPYPPVSAFLKGLNEKGFVEGRNVVIEYRWAEGHYERLPALIADLVQRNVNVIAATSTPASVFAAVHRVCFAASVISLPRKIRSLWGHSRHSSASIGSVAISLRREISVAIGLTTDKSRHRPSTARPCLTQSGHWLCTAAMVLMPVSAPIEVLV